MHKTDFGHFRYHLLRRLDNLRSAVLLDVCHAIYSRMYPANDPNGRLTVEGANQIADALVRHVEVAVEAALQECEWLVNDPELDSIIQAWHDKKFRERYGDQMADRVQRGFGETSPTYRRGKRRRDAAARKLARLYAEKLNGQDPAGHA